MNYKCIHFIATTRKDIKIQIQSYIIHRKIQIQLVKQSNENGLVSTQNKIKAASRQIRHLSLFFNKHQLFTTFKINDPTAEIQMA
jgi:hypothetical protein